MSVKPSFQSVAIAVQDLDAAVDRFREIFDVPLVAQEEHPEERSRWAWFDLGGVYLELVAPMSGDSEVSKFLDRHGEGLFLIGFRVSDIGLAHSEFERAGLHVVYEEAGDSFPRGGSYNFVHPSSFFGTMVEFREFANGGGFLEHLGPH